jgi:hypothetical protein
MNKSISKSNLDKLHKLLIDFSSIEEKALTAEKLKEISNKLELVRQNEDNEKLKRLKSELQLMTVKIKSYQDAGQWHVRGMKKFTPIF